MIDFVGKKFWFFLFSLLLIIPGIISLFLYGLNLGVDFTGGTLIDLTFKQNISSHSFKTTIESKGIVVSTITPAGENSFIVRTKPLSEAEHKKLLEALTDKFPGVKENSHETIGPTIGAELLRKAILAVAMASLAIVVYIALAFRKLPKPASSWRFGISAIIALLHDVLVVIGTFSILGHFLGVEVDALFVTAILTVIGFSVHDTIVVFDRIRENLNKGVGSNFSDTVNHSIMQTLGRSINTSFTVVLVLLPILLFGGSSIRWFTTALLVGVISGTYSSVFNAAQILALWQDWVEKRKNKSYVKNVALRT